MTLKKLGRYELIRVLGKGAMGVVYEGRDPNLDRRVAIKTVKVENLSEAAAAEYEHRFRTEARSAARLQHPNIVSVYDSDRDGDIAFLVMEYIQGDDLKHYLDRGTRYTLEQCLKIIRDLLSALDYAHKQGIVHRDIKPANLLVEPGGRVKLTDFGVARIQDSGEATRTQGSMVGTLKYMAPEQVQGQKIDSRADLFSVGVVLYQLLTDKRPFDGDNDFSIIHQIIGHHPPAPSTVNPRLPAALDAVVARALAKTRDERFATARDFAVALQSAIRRADDPTVVPPADPHKRVEGRSVPGHATAPGGMTNPSVGTVSQVTQELELVYWKDVKDSAEPEDLQGFLEKFPGGIYADLARRRLRKLNGDATNIGGTVTTMPSAPASAAPAAAASDPDLEATRVRTDVSRPLPPSDGSASGTKTQPIAPPAPDSLHDDELDYTRTVVEPRDADPTHDALVAKAQALAQGPTMGAAVDDDPDATPTRPPAVAPAPAPSRAKEPPARVPPPDDDSTAGVAPPRRSKLPVMVASAIAVVAIGGILAAFVGRGGPANAPAPAASAPTVAAAPAPPVDTAPPPPPPTAVFTTPAAPAASAVPDVAAGSSAARLPASGASAVRRPASQTRVAARPASAVVEPARPVFAPPPEVVPAPAPSRPAPPAQPSGNAANAAAVDQCRDRLFLAKELCLAEHCDKPGARNHPLCVKRREDIRLREDSKVRQGPQ